jgi:hypothetical protein
MTGTPFTDPDTGWGFEYEAVTGSGLVLRNVSHEHYRLARDVRVVAVWISETSPEDPANPTPPKKLRLGSPALAPISAPVIVRMPAQPADFGFYRMLTGVSASYAASLGPGSDLSVRQDYEFGPYGKDPPHEPGGVLNAARHLPLLTFRHNTMGGKLIRYIRIDYRLSHALDVFDPSPKVLPAGPPSLNQAGIFRDNEDLPFPVNIRRIPPGPIINDVFAAGEKPLQYEIVGKGLVHGVPLVGSVKATWDNVHQWPKTDGPLPTTPGAFHCCHLHWRFGAVAGTPPASAYARHFVPAAGARYSGLRWTSAQGGPLIDHRLPDQSITFAITTDTDPSRAPDIDGSTHPFANRFAGLPKPVSAGANLVQWFCIEVFRPPDDNTQVWEGTVFIHGLYFGHGAEPGGLQAYLAKLSNSLLRPKPQQKWQRDAA